MSDDFERFTTPRADEELHQGVEAPVVMGISTEDGLPMQVAQRNFDKAPALSEDTLICMADKRSFVVRHADGSIWASFDRALVSQTPKGEYYVTEDAFFAKVKPAAIPSDLGLRDRASRLLNRLWDIAALDLKAHGLLMEVGGSTRFVRVEPIRPQCQHYLRQQTDLSADRDHRYYARSCMAQKTEEGEFYSLRDTLIGACSIREPRHIESEVAILDKFDEEKMSEALNVRSMEEFDVDKELAEEAARGGLGVLGG
jgi:hypothetical protein